MEFLLTDRGCFIVVCGSRLLGRCVGEGCEGIFFVVSVRDFLGTAGLGVVVCQLLTKIGIGIWVGFVVRTTTPLCQNSNSTLQIGSYSARQQNLP